MHDTICLTDVLTGKEPMPNMCPGCQGLIRAPSRVCDSCAQREREFEELEAVARGMAADIRESGNP